MSAKRFNYWPVVFVAALGAALVASNQTPEMPGGGRAINSEAEFQDVKAKMEDLSLSRIEKLDAGKPLTPDDLKKLREASDLVDRMNAYAPIASGLFYLSGKIHFALNEDGIAVERFKQCVLLAPNEAAAKPANAQTIKLTAAEANYQLSLLLLLGRDSKGALDAANDAIGVVPNSPLYLTARASALNELRRTEEAKKDLQAALKLDPSNPRARMLLQFISK